MSKLKRAGLLAATYIIALALLIGFIHINYEDSGESTFSLFKSSGSERNKDQAPQTNSTSPTPKLAQPPQAQQSIGNSVRSATATLGHAIHGQFFCRDNSKGAIATKKNLLYKWTNTAGSVEYSDRAPAQLDYEVIDFSDGSKDYFSLRTQQRAAKLSVDSISQLESKITKTYKILGRMINIQKMRRVEVDLLLLGNPAEYAAIRSRLAPTLSANNQGFYSGLHNKAVVHSKWLKQTEATAIHESVHVINNGLMMHSPRWLNEGLAEYFEGLKAIGSAAEISPIPAQIRWLKTHRPAPITELLDARTRWQDDRQSSYYATAWALVYFFMGERNQRGVFGDFLNQIIDDGCDATDSITWMQQHYPGGVQNLQRQFSKWLKQTDFSKHYY